MTASSAAPVQILREVFKGTGVGDPETYGAVQRGGAFDGLLGGSASARVAPLHESWKFALSTTSFAGGAFLIAIAALIVSWQSLERMSSYREVIQTIDAGLAELPVLKTGLETVAADVKQERASQQRVLEASTLAESSAESARADFYQSIDGVNHRIDHALDAVKAQEVDLSSRLGKVEADQTSEIAALQSLQLRTTPADRFMQASLIPARQDLSVFHLRSVSEGRATVEGPDGQASVAVGDTLFNLGKVLRIGKRGRKAVLTTEHGRLTMSWPRVHPKPKPVAVAN
jgi:hypothetical protein